MAKMKIKFAQLVKDGLQTRTGLDEKTVADYADAMRAGEEFPPVKVYHDGSRYLLADGFHRVEAAVRAGAADIVAEVEFGTFVDALRYALGCNARHGLRLTNEDKRNALQMAWDYRRELFGANDPTAEWLANTCGVSNNTAQSFYSQISPNCGDLTPQRQNAEGRVYTMPRRPVRPVAQPQAMPTMPQRPTPPAAPARPVPVCVDKDGKEHFAPLDRYGVEIPVKLQPAFNAENTDKLEQLHKLVSEARCLLKHEIEAGNTAFGAMGQEAGFVLDHAYQIIKFARPHCVCRLCQGQGCKACHERGWQKIDEYERNPSEYKAESEVLV